jgi:hypothetical protein
VTDTEPPAEAGETVTELRPGMGGVWLVKTLSSEHIWDLDRWTYERRPGPGRSQFDGDNEAYPIVDAPCMPKVGESFRVIFDWSATQDQWRISTEVKSIERYEAAASASESEQEEASK